MKEKKCDILASKIGRREKSKMNNNKSLGCSKLEDSQGDKVDSKSYIQIEEGTGTENIKVNETGNK